MNTWPQPPPYRQRHDPSHAWKQYLLPGTVDREGPPRWVVLLVLGVVVLGAIGLTAAVKWIDYEREHPAEPLGRRP